MGARGMSLAVVVGVALSAAPALGSGYEAHRASAYGPGLYGNVLGCYSYRVAHGLDGRLRTDSNLVAHRSLPCGTRLAVSYGRRTAVTVVGDRGPYIAGRTFDIGPGVWQRLGFPDPWAFGERVVSVRVLGPLGRGERQTRAGRDYPPRAVYAQRARQRVRLLVRKYGEWPPPIHDLTLAGIVAGWVLPQPPGSVDGARATCAPAASTSRFRCRVSAGARLLRSPLVEVTSTGAVRVVR